VASSVCNEKASEAIVSVASGSLQTEAKSLKRGPDSGTEKEAARGVKKPRDETTGKTGIRR